MWFLQHKNYGLGNFIMLTSALRGYYKQTKNRANVFFETKAIKSVFLNCPFINILKKKPKGRYKLSSFRPNRKNSSLSDSEVYCRMLLKKKKVYKTYIDFIESNKLKNQKNKCIAVFHGCAGYQHLKNKDIGTENRQLIIETIKKYGFIPVILGNQKDIDNFWKNNDLSDTISYLNKLSLKEAIGVLQECIGFISNDTGLYHAAAASGMRGLVLWKKTNLKKNKAVSRKIQYSISEKADQEKYKKDINFYLKSI